MYSFKRKAFIGVIRKPIVFLFAILVILSSLFTPFSRALADESALYKAPNDAINKEIYAKNSDGMVYLTTDDIENYENIEKWLSHKNSYIWVKNENGKISYYFNTPNLQLSISNFVQQLNSGGWSLNSYNYDENIGNKSEDTFTTAEKKYGYNLPQGVYLGEMPAITLDLSRIVSDSTTGLNGIANAVTIAHDLTIGKLIKGFWGLFGIDYKFENAIVDFDPSYIEGVFYNLEDYNNSSLDYTTAISEWLEQNWEKLKSHGSIKVDDKNIFDDGVLVGEDETVGGNLSGEELYSRIIKMSSSSYKKVFDLFSNIADEDDGIPEMPTSNVTRHMPYDITQMSKASAKYMNGVIDQRVVMFGDTQLIGATSSMMKQISNMLVNITLINFSANLCKFGQNLNSICDLELIRSSGVDPTMVWDGSVGQFIICGLTIIVILFLVFSIFKIIKGTGSSEKVMAKAVMTSLLLAFVIGLAASPKSFGDLISNTASKVLSVSTVTFDISDDFKELHTSDAGDTDKSALRYWYMYLNIWSTYNTGYTTNEDASKFSPSQNTNEYTDYTSSPAKLKNGDTVNLWPVILIEEMANGNFRACYRVSDHYLAPDIKKSSSWTTFDVSQNKYFETTGRYMYSEIPFNSLINCIVVIIFTFFKVLVFLELLMNIFLFFLKMIFSAIEGRSFLVDSIKAICQSVGKVIAYDFCITFTIMFSTYGKGTAAVVISLLLATGAGMLIHWIIEGNRNNPFYPTIFGIVSDKIEQTKIIAGGMKGSLSSSSLNGERTALIEAYKNKGLEAKGLGRSTSLRTRASSFVKSFSEGNDSTEKPTSVDNTPQKGISISSQLDNKHIEIDNPNISKED